MQPESALEQGDSWEPRSWAVPTSDLSPTGFEQNLAQSGENLIVGLGGSGPILALAPQPWASLCPQNPLDLPALPAPRQFSHCGSACGKCRTEPVAQAQQNLQQSPVLKGSILTWFSQEAPCQGVNAVVAGRATHTAAEQCCYVEMPLFRGP